MKIFGYGCTIQVEMLKRGRLLCHRVTDDITQFPGKSVKYNKIDKTPSLVPINAFKNGKIRRVL